MNRSILALAAVLAAAGLVADSAEGQGSRSRRQSGTTQESPPPQTNQKTQRTAPKPVSAIGYFGREGGRLTITAGDGWRYELEIPRFALLWGERIEMTVLPAVQGLPDYLRQPRGVTLSPAGVKFAREVILTITPAQPPADRSLLAILSVLTNDSRPLPAVYLLADGRYRLPLVGLSSLRLAALDVANLDRYLAYLDQLYQTQSPVAWDAELARLLELLGAGPVRLDDWIALLARAANGLSLKRLAAVGRPVDPAQLARLDATFSAVDARVLKPMLDQALSRDATCAQMVEALRAALALDAIRRAVGVGAALPVVDRLLGGDLADRIAKICEGSCAKAGDLLTEIDLNILRARLRELQGRETAELLALADKLEQVSQTRLNCMRYRVKVTTRQQNASIAPAHGLVHDLRVDDQVEADVAALVTDLLDDEAKPVRDATGRPIRRLAVQGEGDHRPANYIYNFEDRNKSQTCFTMNSANTAVARERMVIELSPHGTGHIVRIRPGNITLNFWHWTCTLKKDTYPFDDLWRNGFNAAYPVFSSGGRVAFPVARKSAYPEIGQAEFSGTGINSKASPENEDLRTTQTTTISIVHRP